MKGEVLEGMRLHYFEEAVSRTRKRFLQLSIATKLLLGFLPLFILTLLMAAYGLTNLNRLNRLNRGIVRGDIPLIQAADRMIDSLYSQEIHGNHYVILKSIQNMELFTDAGMDFRNQLVVMSRLPDADHESIQRISDLHEEYGAIFMDWFQASEESEPAPIDFEAAIAEKQNELDDLIKELRTRASSKMNEKTLAAAMIGANSTRIFGTFCIFSLLLGFTAAYAITRNISGAVTRLKNATFEIAKGKFDIDPDIRNQDELGDLARSFTDMAGRLKRLEEMYLDTSPLTHMPGGIAIENVLKKRITSGAQFAFCLIDLDNFKAYNDHYGYARGNRVIKTTAGIIEEAAKKYGDDHTFSGHIGGDDFVVICGLGEYAKICRRIVNEFDKTVTDLYDPHDLKLGTIIHKSRSGEAKEFPLMTISIGVVTNRKRRFTHYVQVGEIAAEVKNYAKSKPGSLYYVDRRKGTP
jgi:diguanylate cyclase (GGDEF)-like protein